MDGSIPPSSSRSIPSIPPSSSSSSSSTIPPTTTVASTPSSSSSAVFRPRRSEDWQQYRPIIEHLYLNNQLKLRDVKIIMERDHHFVASEKQYKDRLAAWHIRKNIKAKEVQVMIRKQQKRAARGKQTAFRVGGQEVDSKRISRFLRRYGSSWENPKSPPQTNSPEPQTPTDMSCYTPEPEDRSSALSPMPEISSDPRETPHRPVWTMATNTEYVLGALDASPLDPNHPIPSHHPHPAEMPDDQPLSATLSPSLTNDTPKPLDDDLHEEDPWHALVSFQDRLLVLHQTLEQSMSDYTTPLDD
ncbi:hypothetical protein SI65_04738 [Aspergillus cristatus]|uniref:Clr5 domain-containing protein n=1 Tax=Aspergillus cristatus TaxID=573508 RepID=A0A1E3BFL4_ASPCR|nr:hypothetical protein SI65_04738 [Aspergillus cristatus]